MKIAVSLPCTGYIAGELIHWALQPSDNCHFPQLPGTEDLFWVDSAANEYQQIPTSPALDCRRFTLRSGSSLMVAPGWWHRFHTRATHAELLVHRGGVAGTASEQQLQFLPQQLLHKFSPGEGQSKPRNLATLTLPRSRLQLDHTVGNACPGEMDSKITKIKNSL